MDLGSGDKIMPTIVHPPVLINAYLSTRISDTLPYFDGSSPFMFFPTSPTSIDELTETFPDAAASVFAVYDRMFRLRRAPFPHIKQEQLLYYFYKTAGGPQPLIETIQIVYDLLDRGDESAQELNHWLATERQRQIIEDGYSGTTTANNSVSGSVQTFDSIKINGTDFLMPYFHELKIFQLEEARDIIAFGTARTYAGNKLIVNYDYHNPMPK
jgi:hypothetical protein